MKYIRLICATALILCISACSSNKKGTEESKTIATNQVKFSGEYPDDLSVGNGEIKIILTNPEGEKWGVRASIPLVAKSKNGEVRDIAVEFLDGNGMKINHDVSISSDDEKSIFAASGSSVEIPIKESYSWGLESYSKMKELYDKVAGIKITLTYYKTSNNTVNNDSDNDDDDIDDMDDIYDQAQKEVDKAYNEAKKEYDKAYNQAKKEYDKAYKQAQKEMEDWDW